MKLINKTKWNTQQLKALCRAVIKHVGSHKRHQICVKTSRAHWDSHYGGLAYINGNTIVMKVPVVSRLTREWLYEETTGEDGQTKRQCTGFKKVTQRMTFDPVRFAQVLEHEVGHNLGLRKHRDMVRSTDLNADYAKAFTVEPQQPRQKPVINRVEVNRQRAEANLKRAQTRYKRALSLLKRCERKMRYYGAKGQQAPA